MDHTDTGEQPVEEEIAEIKRYEVSDRQRQDPSVHCVGVESLLMVLQDFTTIGMRPRSSVYESD